jgi:hypothetical protein
MNADGVLDEWERDGNRNARASGTDEVKRAPHQVTTTMALRGPHDLCPYSVRGRYDGNTLLWQGPGDLAANVQLGRDRDALCIAAEVTDDKHFNTKSGGAIWDGDSLQLGLVTADGGEWNLGLALTGSGAVFRQFTGRGDALAKVVGCAVVRDEAAGVTRYELRLPLAALGVEPGANIGFNVVVFDDDDGSGQCCWLQLAPGLAGRDKNTAPPAKLYPQVFIAKMGLIRIKNGTHT